MGNYKIISIGSANDIRGERFGRLVVIDRVDKNDGRVNWLCECDCGNKAVVRGDSLVKDNATRSCGCLNKEKARLIGLSKVEDLTGRQFGRLKVLKRAPNRNNEPGQVMWECKCECGNIFIALAQALKNGSTQSCGCLRAEKIRERCFIDLTGKRYGRLTVVKIEGFYKAYTIYECKCDCGQTVFVRGGNLTHDQVKSCGCLHIDAISGENSFHYNPNKTDEERLKERYILGEHAKNHFRNAVFERDDYTCKVCGTKGGRLNAHHLNAWSWDKNNRFNVNNGITLCQKCHKLFHSKYGKGENTKEQFIAFRSRYYNEYIKKQGEAVELA